MLPPTEPILADLERALARDGSHVVLATAPGPGTELLMDALSDRLAGPLRVVRLAASTVDAGELCARILCRMAEPSGPDAEARLLLIVQDLASRGTALVLLIRNADRIPGETLHRLGRLAAASRRGLRLGLVLEVDSRAGCDGVLALVTAAIGGCRPPSPGRWPTSTRPSIWIP